MFTSTVLDTVKALIGSFFVNIPVAESPTSNYTDVYNVGLSLIHPSSYKAPVAGSFSLMASIVIVSDPPPAHYIGHVITISDPHTKEASVISIC